MKTLALITLFFISNANSDEYIVRQTEEICPNKTVFVTVDSKSVKKVKMKFSIISSLPFDVREVSQNGSETKLAITHSIAGGKPDAWKLQNQVRKILEDDYKNFGVSRITVDYDPSIRCK